MRTNRPLGKQRPCHAGRSAAFDSLFCAGGDFFRPLDRGLGPKADWIDMTGVEARERETLASIFEGIADSYMLAAELTRAGKLDEASGRLEQALKAVKVARANLEKPKRPSR